MYVKVIPYDKGHQGSIDIYECSEAHTRVDESPEIGSEGYIFILDMERNGESFRRIINEQEWAEIYLLNENGRTIDKIMWTPSIPPKD
jgi:hypothetical protein